MSEMTTLFKKEVRKYTTEVFQNFNELAPKTPIDNDPFDFGVNSPIRSSSPQGSFNPIFVSEDEIVFLENYANPLSSLTMLRKTLVIEENENKIALKCYNYRNHRDVAKKYFIVRRDITYLTFNIKRKTFYSGILRLKKRAKIGSKMSMNKTDLYSMDVYNQIFYFMSYLNNEYDSNNLTNEVINLFLNRVSERIDIKFDKEDLTPRDKFYQLYLKISGIKYPDAFSKFVTYYTPKKEIREHGNNLVTWFMKKNGFKGTKIRELLNKYNNVDINGLTSFYKLLGQNLFNTINSECFLTESKLGSEYYGMWSQIPEMLSKKELYNICKILNTTKSETLLNSLGDHIHYKESLKKYGEFVKITATNYDDYVKEHSEWSSLIQSYRTGLVTRFYGDDAYLIEKPINHNDKMYYPVLLTKTEEYENESAHQSNCVRTYSEKAHSLIISLRNGSVNGEQRATIEYHIRKNELKRVQTLGKYNKSLPEDWVSPIDELDKFVNYLYSKDIIKLPKMNKRYKKRIDILINKKDKQVKYKNIKISKLEDSID
jgi:uncharacterized protein (DUF3820 family)